MTSHPSPIGVFFSSSVSGTPGLRLGLVGGMYPVLPLSLNTPPLIEEAMVFTLPLATCIGAVLYFFIVVAHDLYVLYALVDSNPTETGVSLHPQVEYDAYLEADIEYI